MLLPSQIACLSDGIHGSSGDSCDSNCIFCQFGNDIKTADESCDDEDLIYGVVCDSNCNVTGCGNLVVTNAKERNDGDEINGDGCNTLCTLQSYDLLFELYINEY